MLLRLTRVRRVPLRICYAQRPAQTLAKRLNSSMATEESLTQEIQQQSALVNKLKADGAEAAAIDDAWKKLGELKKSLLGRDGRAGRWMRPGRKSKVPHLDVISPVSSRGSKRSKSKSVTLDT